MSLAPFSWVVAEYGPTVWRVCRSMLAADEADDAWSETFLAALRAYPDLGPDANVAAWLTTIARRKAIDVIRRRARSAEPVDQVPDAGVHAEALESVDDELRVALATLSDRQRVAVVAHHVVGFPFAHVAELLDTTPAAARRSAADGIAKLRAHYRKEHR